MRRGENKLFHTLHFSWIHHNSKKSNWILLSQKYAHIQTTMKNFTKSSRRRSEHQLFHSCHTHGSTTIQKNNWILPYWLYEHLQLTIKHWTKFQVFPIGHLGKEVSTSYFTPSTPLGSTITHNWVLPSWQYTPFQMKVTLYKVSISTQVSIRISEH
jgi:hypothetical protein